MWDGESPFGGCGIPLGCCGFLGRGMRLIGAVGGSVTFHSPKTAPEGNAALWSFGNYPILTVAFGDPPRPIFSEEKFRTRFTVSERGRALSISQLRMEDAGTYSVTIDGKKISTFTLLAQDCLDKVCLLSLRCSVTGTGFGNVSYTWRGWDQRWEERPVVLTVVDKSSTDEVEPLRCTARNAVSSRSVTVTTPEGLCPGESRGKGHGKVEWECWGWDELVLLP
uniref:Ig-like domain-containing protein n=1 Tax=Zosterops lateralis melanops TaxID=1220523 RepID=A0A8D2PI57_ZOSLA